MKKFSLPLFTKILNITFVDYGVNSILFQRGIYPAENFNPVQQYGLTILMSKDEKIKDFLTNVLGQATDWLAQNKVDKFSLIISNVYSKEVLECWDFKVEADPIDQNQEPNQLDPTQRTSTKEIKKIQSEIGAVMRQIAATVTYLP